jgi:surface protein
VSRKVAAQFRRESIVTVMSVVLVSFSVILLGLPGVVQASLPPLSNVQSHRVSASDTCAGMDLTFVITAAGVNVEIPLQGTVNANVNWGDGDSTVETTAPGASHVYTDAGTYDVCITGSVSQFGFGSVQSPWPGSNYLTTVNSWGSLGTTSFAGAFLGASSLTSVPTSLPVAVTDISYMFWGDTSFDQPLETWDTSNVTLMESVFNGATSFDQPLNSWNVSNVTSTFNMFSDATNFNEPLNNWDTANITDMQGMFAGSGFDQNIDDWNVSNVTTIDDMFDENQVFNQPLDDWNVSSLDSLSAVFESDPVFNQPLNNWNTSNVSNMWLTFYEAKDFNQDISNWDTSSVGNYGMYHIFSYSGLSSTNYDAFLIAAAARPEMQGVDLDAAGIYYCPAAAAAHSFLFDTYGWDINDSGLGTTQCGGSATTTTTAPQGSTTTTTTGVTGGSTTTTTVASGGSTTTTTAVGSTTTTVNTTSTTSIPGSTTTSMPKTGPPRKKHISAMSAMAVPVEVTFGAVTTLIARGIPRSATGVVTFRSAKMKLCSGRVIRGEARCVAPRSLKRAVYNVLATYAGDSRYLPRTVSFRFRVN